MKGELVVDARAAHGEGPAWDGSTDTLYWVDLTGQSLHATDAATGSDRVIKLDDLV